MSNANYLPVLLVSVSTNAAPDDSSVTTRPRAQVDYLSHEWQEEDVWRSWRNMTRQKNEITNGIRLENASWRTWWKQRNKLKTVTPETLNWLKDSDVTWLYGPLHTASDDKPLLKPPGIGDDSSTIHKPILKYRSITELLTSDLPNSPVFSPVESEDEDSPVTSKGEFALGTSLPSPSAFPRRPMLQHTKSDTHITRWGPNRAYRKDSPPRIDPPGHTTVPDGYFPKVQAGGPVRSSLSQDSNSSAGNSANGERTGKKKHISFNTFVEQVIAIDQPKRSASFYGGAEKAWDARRVFDDDDGYEEDQEDSAEEDADPEDPWNSQRIRSTDIHGYPAPEFDEEEEGIIEMRTSFRNATPKKVARSQSKASNASSSSSVSTASSTTTNSTANSSSSPSRDSLSSMSTARRMPLTRRTSSSTYRPHLVRAPLEHVHVTIAPIAPTVLKTTEMWEEGFGDEGAGSDDGFGWRERLWGYNDNAKGKSKSKRRGADYEDNQGSDASGTPVELVYVPPFNSRYSFGYAEEDEDEDEINDVVYGVTQGFDDELEEEEYTHDILQSRPSYCITDAGVPLDVYLHRGTAAGSVGFEDYPDPSGEHFVGSPPESSIAGVPIPIPANAGASDIAANDQYTIPPSAPKASSIPKLVVMQQGKSTYLHEEDETDFFGGDPDYGNEYMEPPREGGRSGYGKHQAGKNRFTVGADERPSRSTSRTPSSRSRSMSHSRTPSPAIEPIVAVDVTADEPLRRSYSSVSPPSSHLAPPTRGRSHQDVLQGSSRSSQSNSRGRSASRNSGPSSLESSTSPFGSLSPDSTGVRYGRANAYVGSGRLERERDRTGGERRGRDVGKERARGRDRTTTDKRLSVSVSSSPDQAGSSRRESSSATTETSSSTEVPPNSSASSTSSSKTIIPEEQEQHFAMTEEDYQREAEDFLRRAHPTPSNSPIIQMRAPPPADNGLISEQGTPTPSSIAAAANMDAPTKPAHSSQVSATTPTPTKARLLPPPTLVPSASVPALPSTSYTAVSSPSPTSPKVAVSPRSTTSGGVAVAPIAETHSASTVANGSAKHRSTDSSDSSIIGKASEIVSHAGAFLGLWNHSSL